MKCSALALLWVLPFFGQSAAPPNKTTGLTGVLDYVLAPNDHVLIRAPQAEKINGQVFKIEADGSIALGSVGRIQVGGLTVKSFESELARRLRKSASDEPKVAVSVVNFKGAPRTRPPTK
jgi:protein involved in polysaccharide export with SLBB domain